MKANNNEQTLIERAKQRFIEAMKKLQALGAGMITTRSGQQMMYVPGNVNLNSPTPVDLYGAFLAGRRRGHKSFLRKHNLGKFKKGK